RIQIVLDQGVDDLLEILDPVLPVSVEPGEVFARGLPQGRLDRGTVSPVALVVNESNPGDGLQKFSRPVRGAVLDDDDLRFGEAFAQVSQDVCDRRRLVVGWYANRELHSRPQAPAVTPCSFAGRSLS